ncbi:MAG: Sensor histidine kinase [Verrucomicrobiales bacterium]|nr:Sensor histidine kinase [Verrucomicrobiales bacterium]
MMISLLLWKLRWVQGKRAELEEFSSRLLRSQEKERRRMATEIHDGLSQNLLIINSRAGLGLRAGNDEKRMQEQFMEIEKICIIAIQEAREIAHNLGPSHLESTGLTEALEVMIDRVAASTRLQFVRRLEKVDELFSSDSAIHLYRITQEALNNVLKHAKATSVRVELIREIAHVELKIEDNGQGMALNQKTGSAEHYRHGLGLAGMSERARILGGTFKVDSGASRGTSLRVMIPISKGAKI